MTTITFDTDAIIQHLKRAGLTEEQAREFVQAVKDAQTELATKDDLALLKSDFETRLTKLENSLLTKLGAMLIAGFGLMVALKIFS